MKMKTIMTVGVAAVSLSVTACGSASLPMSPTSVAVSGGIDGREVTTSVRPSARPDSPVALKPGPLTIVGVVLEEDGEFDVLQAAVVRAGLVDVLNGTTQYTVFAPTDLAFATTLGVSDEAAAIAAVNSLPMETLTDILRFHVTHGRRARQTVLAAPSYQMLNGAKLTRSQLTAAGLAATDISASNGIVHVINAVLLPE